MRSSWWKKPNTKMSWKSIGIIKNMVISHTGANVLQTKHPTYYNSPKSKRTLRTSATQTSRLIASCYSTFLILLGSKAHKQQDGNGKGPADESRGINRTNIIGALILIRLTRADGHQTVVPGRARV